VAKNALDAKFSAFKRARDLVQDFFAYLLQGNAYTHTNRRKSKFRWLLLASLKHYIADVWDPGEHSSETAIMRSYSWMRKFMRLNRLRSFENLLHCARDYCNALF
jgi:hypothetical protein